MFAWLLARLRQTRFASQNALCVPVGVCRIPHTHTRARNRCKVFALLSRAQSAKCNNSEEVEGENKATTVDGRQASQIIPAPPTAVDYTGTDTASGVHFNTYVWERQHKIETCAKQANSLTSVNDLGQGTVPATKIEHRYCCRYVA